MRRWHDRRGPAALTLTDHGLDRVAEKPACNSAVAQFARGKDSSSSLESETVGSSRPFRSRRRTPDGTTMMCSGGVSSVCYESNFFARSFKPWPTKSERSARAGDQACATTFVLGRTVVSSSDFTRRCARPLFGVRMLTACDSPERKSVIQGWLHANAISAFRHLFSHA